MNITTKAIAEEATSNYLSKIQPTTPHKENIRLYLRPIVESLTKKMLQSDEKEKEKKSKMNGSDEMDHNGHDNTNNTIFNHQYGKQRSSSIGSEGDEEEDEEEERTLARMEAFLKHCGLAVPKEPISSNTTNTKIAQDEDNNNSLFSLSTALLGLKEDEISNLPPRPATRILRSLSSNTNTVKEYPQFDSKDLFIRLDIYLKSLKRVSATQEECVLGYESTKILQARINCIIRSLLANMEGGTSSIPTLLQLLSFVTMEILAIHILDEEIQSIMEKLCRDYEHQISFASLTFLSSPEQSIKFLSPLLLSYLQYLQVHHERFECNSSIESMLRATIPSATRTLFKKTEFLSIAHVLSTCQSQADVLSQLVLPSISHQTLRQTCKDDGAVQQALRDLQREIIMVNGFILPTVTTYKELVQWLGDLLNSRNVGNRRCASGNEADLENNDHDKRNNTALEYKTIDKMTKRLLLSSSRTRAGGDAYFIVKDLFGCDDVVIVPHHHKKTKKHAPSSSPTTSQRKKVSNNTSNKHNKKHCTIEIQVRLSSLIIKCYAAYDVIPNYISNNNNVEPLITLETTTSETISLQAVRVCDANSSDDDAGINSDGGSNFGVVLREKKTNVTGKRILCIKPAKYTKVAVWNTPS